MSGELAELANSARRALSSLRLGAPEQDVWPRVVDLGWLLAGVPEDLDGLGLGLPAVCAIQQEIGRRLGAAPYAVAALVIDAVCQSALKDRAAWAKRLVEGDMVTAPLVASSVQLKADGRVTGSVGAVPSADRASHVLVCGADIVALLPSASLQLKARPTWDETQRLFDVALPSEGIEPAAVVAKGKAALALTERLASHLDFALGADSVGGAAALLELTVEYLQTRKQFGRPLGMFQALKHRCADLKVSVSAAEALLSDALERATSHDTDTAVLAVKAKQFACSVYAQVAEEAIQLHGGIGMTAEHHCHLFLKRAQLNEHLGWQREPYEISIADSYLKLTPDHTHGVMNDHV